MDDTLQIGRLGLRLASRITLGEPAPEPQGRDELQRIKAEKVRKSCRDGKDGRDLFTFRSRASQISTAMSGPPKALTWRMPVGEVTLISVR